MERVFPDIFGDVLKRGLLVFYAIAAQCYLAGLEVSNPALSRVLRAETGRDGGGMYSGIAGRLGGRLHYSWVVMGLVFLCLLAAAGIRATPGVLIVPLEQSLGWSRATISLAVAVNVFLYGLMGPFAAACMQRFGIRRTVLSALTLLALVVAASTQMTAVWQLMLTWGVLVGIGSGCVAVVLAAAVVNRWFVERRGLVMGILTASTATGQLVFLPLLAAVVERGGWQPVAWIVAGVAAAVVVLAGLLLPESPKEIG